MSLRQRYCAAAPFDLFLQRVQSNAELWRALSRRAVVPDDALARVRALGGRWHLLVLAEDWCGDAVNTLPALAALAGRAGNLDLRVLPRDANDDLMNEHLTGGSRSIPVVIVLDHDFVERGWWGPRPSALRRWFASLGRAMPKEERYREMRRWYARDRGASALDEVIAVLEAANRNARAA